MWEIKKITFFPEKTILRGMSGFNRWVVEIKVTISKR